MRNVTLRQLRYFEALARQGHFGRAAAVSAVSQPALSVQIRDLEAEIGVALFERTPRNVRLTAFGETFRVRAREILRAVDDLGDLARGACEGVSGRLRIGVIPTVAPYLLPRLMRPMTRSWPGLSVEIRETTTAHLVDELADGALDTAIVALPVSEGAFHEALLFSEPFLLVRPAGDRDCPMPDRESLRGERLLLLEEGHCFRDQALSFCDMDRSGAAHALDATSLSTLVQMVGAGLGVTLIPEMAVAVETRSAEVAVSRFATPEPSRDIGMIWRKTTPLAAQLGMLADTIRHAVGAGKPAPGPGGLGGDPGNDRRGGR